MDLWEVMVSIFWFFVLVAWISLLFSILGDLFRDHELSGWGKAGWTLLVIALPWIGCLTYLIARGQGMSERAWTEAQRRDDALRAHLRDTAPPAAPAQPSTADELAKLADLRQRDAISSEDYDWAKSMLLQPDNGASATPPTRPPQKTRT